MALLSDEQFKQAWELHKKGDGHTDQEFFSALVKKGYMSSDDASQLKFNNDGSLNVGGEEETSGNDDTSGGDEYEVPENNTEGWGYHDTELSNDESNQEIPKQILATAGSKIINSEGMLGKYGTLGIKPLLTNIATKVLSSTPAMDALLNFCAKHAEDMFSIAKDGELVKDLMYNQGDKIASKVSQETKKKVVGKFLGTLAQGIYTDAVMIKNGLNDDKSGLQKDTTWASALNALDSATETLPVLSWIDLGADLLLSGKKDENGEGYSKGGLLSKVNYAINNLSGKDNARTIWENDPAKQEEIKKGNDWMEEQGFTRGGLFTPSKPGAKNGSKADVMLKNDKAIDEIQGNTAGKGKKATDGVSVDKEQQDKRDANLYISWLNKSKGLKLDSKNAYTYKDFVKDFEQKKDGTWENKKTKQTAGEMWRKLKNSTEKPEGDIINL